MLPRAGNPGPAVRSPQAPVRLQGPGRHAGRAWEAAICGCFWGTKDRPTDYRPPARATARGSRGAQVREAVARCRRRSGRVEPCGAKLCAAGGEGRGGRDGGARGGDGATAAAEPRGAPGHRQVPARRAPGSSRPGAPRPPASAAHLLSSSDGSHRRTGKQGRPHRRVAAAAPEQTGRSAATAPLPAPPSPPAPSPGEALPPPRWRRQLASTPCP